MTQFFGSVRELAIEGFGRQKAGHQLHACVDFPHGVGWLDTTEGVMGLVGWRVFKAACRRIEPELSFDWYHGVVKHMQSKEGMEGLFGAPYSFFYDGESVTEEEGERRSDLAHQSVKGDESQCSCGCSGEYPCGKPGCLHHN